MTLRERIGIDLSRNMRIEDGVQWAARNNVKYLDIQLDNETNAITTFDSKRVAAVRTAREKHGIHIGLHTSSAVNVAESPLPGLVAGGRFLKVRGWLRFSVGDSTLMARFFSWLTAAAELHDNCCAKSSAILDSATFWAAMELRK